MLRLDFVKNCFLFYVYILLSLSVKFFCLWIKKEKQRKIITPVYFCSWLTHGYSQNSLSHSIWAGFEKLRCWEKDLCMPWGVNTCILWLRMRQPENCAEQKLKDSFSDFINEKRSKVTEIFYFGLFRVENVGATFKRFRSVNSRAIRALWRYPQDEAILPRGRHRGKRWCCSGMLDQTTPLPPSL